MIAESILLIFAILGVIIGVIGTIVPFLPGTFLIFFTALLYGLLTGFVRISLSTILLLGVFSVIGMVLDFVLVARGVKRAGGTRPGMIGAVLGVTIGMFLASLPGALIGALLGAVIGEVIAGTAHKRIPRAATGAVLGTVVSRILQFGMALVMSGMLVVDFFRS